MTDTFENIFQLKLSMKDITPQIWRRIQVPENYTFLDLHIAIQSVMSWENYHLHEFEVRNPETRLRDRIEIEDEEHKPAIPDYKTKISSYFTPRNKNALYRYDFGDDWEMKIQLEAILPRKEGVEYPVCTAGERAAPPEDTGGISDYKNKLQILKDPKHERYEEIVEWLGEDFDPEHFDPKDISFDHEAGKPFW